MFSRVMIHLERDGDTDELFTDVIDWKLIETHLPRYDAGDFVDQSW